MKLCDVKKSDMFKDLQLLKTLMMIFVVLCHACAFYTGDWFNVLSPKIEAKYLGILSIFLGTFHVQTFTMVSGFLFYYLKEEKGRYNEFLLSVRIRAKKLLFPYMFCSLLWVIPITHIFYDYTIKDYLIKYGLMTSPSQLWFLIMLFFVFIIFLLISSKLKINLTNLIIIYFFSMIIGNLLSLLHISFFQAANIVKNLFYYYLGGYIYYNKEKITKKQVKVALSILLLLYIPFIYSFFINGFNKYILKAIESLISFFEIIIAYYYCKLIVNNNKFNDKNKIYKYFSNNSFGIYLFHQQIIYFVIFLLNDTVHPIIIFILSFTISIIVSSIMSSILRKNKITKNMFGL